MILIFNSQDMIDFVKWYNEENEYDCYGTYEEMLKKWLRIQADGETEEQSK